MLEDVDAERSDHIGRKPVRDLGAGQSAEQGRRLIEGTRDALLEVGEHRGRTCRAGDAVAFAVLYPWPYGIAPVTKTWYRPSVSPTHWWRRACRPGGASWSGANDPRRSRIGSQRCP